MNIYTHTLSETVMRSLDRAIESGLSFQVLVSESQPNRDGVITAQRLASRGVRVTLGLDAAMGALVSQADLMLTGAEAITPHGSAICKVGTYLAALAASTHGVPYYVLADIYKFIPTLVLSFFTEPGSFAQAGLFKKPGIEGVQYCEDLFDTTPAGLISGIVTEKGVISPFACGFFQQDDSSSERVLRLLDEVRGARLENNSEN
jgi:translation initiation factor 2B subunit (eIF-2B alpha/beta/delta family)